MLNVQFSPAAPQAQPFKAALRPATAFRSQAAMANNATMANDSLTHSSLAHSSLNAPAFGNNWRRWLPGWMGGKDKDTPPPTTNPPAQDVTEPVETAQPTLPEPKLSPQEALRKAQVEELQRVQAKVDQAMPATLQKAAALVEALTITDRLREHQVVHMPLQLMGLAEELKADPELAGLNPDEVGVAVEVPFSGIIAHSDNGTTFSIRLVAPNPYYEHGYALQQNVLKSHGAMPYKPYGVEPVPTGPIKDPHELFAMADKARAISKPAAEVVVAPGDGNGLVRFTIQPDTGELGHFHHQPPEGSPEMTHPVAQQKAMVDIIDALHHAFDGLFEAGSGYGDDGYRMTYRNLKDPKTRIHGGPLTQRHTPEQFLNLARAYRHNHTPYGVIEPDITLLEPQSTGSEAT